ncbi:hypothetical protein [Luteibacter sp. 9135]|uniref:hypothetical protein n=1 Tax=Luteibacter sp. 9135 TaxID=1500893 RepID=UPI00056A9E6F|nr:hypothetical protein [Luteibacter sp. 9135]
MERTGQPSRISRGVTATVYCRSILLGAMAALLFAPPLPAVAAVEAMPAVPDEVRAVLAPDDLVLAYEKADATGDGAMDLVIAVYRGARFTEQPDTSADNACELLVFTGSSTGTGTGAQSAWKEAERSREAIDCVDNPVMDRPREMAYHDNLLVKPGAITWSNQGVRRHTTFAFVHHRADGHWYVSSMSQGYVLTNAGSNSDVVMAYGEIASPRDFPLTPMSELKAAPLQRLLDTRTSTDD